jgi:dynein assembly factor 1
MPKIAVIYMQGNTACKKIKNYRKTLVAKLPTLKYLDDRPVFEDDRIFAEAFHRGGFDEERKERERVRKQKEDEHWKNHENFQEMIRKAREEKKLAEEAKKAAATQRMAIEEAPKVEEGAGVSEQTVLSVEEKREEIAPVLVVEEK